MTGPEINQFGAGVLSYSPRSVHSGTWVYAGTPCGGV